MRVTDTLGITSRKQTGARLPTTFLRPQFAAPLGMHADAECSNEQEYDSYEEEEEEHGCGHASAASRPQYGSSTGIQESVLDYSVAPDASCHRAAPVGYSNVNSNLSHLPVG